MHRRDFLKFQAAAALSIGAAALGFPPRLLADASPDIAVVKGGPAAATRAAVELLGGMSAFVRPGQKVVIKPNLSFAADIASASGFIAKADKGWETVVGERGVTLSGGQKQRIAIARTLLKDNNILIFDDSLSAVDTETDAQIRAALRHEQKDVTTLIISHRVTTLSQADLILVLENGQITQQGTHAELCSQPGLYQRINSIQNALEEELTQAKAAEGVN